MEAWEIDLAKMFKARDNKQPQSVTMGKIITVSPLSVSLGDEVILDSNDLVIASRIKEIPLFIGDWVILIPTADGQKYYAIDKVGGSL